MRQQCTVRVFLAVVLLMNVHASSDVAEGGLPLGPFEKMLSSHGKNPLVAATYYFNPGTLLRNEAAQDFEISGREIHPNDPEKAAEASDSDSCSAPDGRKGVCFDAKECTSRGGTPMGTCSSSASHASGGQQGASSSSKGSVCCLFEISCGDFSSERFLYFRNPGFPQPYRQQRMCRVRIGKKDKSICQYRVDLITFDLAPPFHGNCSQDIFVVSGQNENNVVPKICGRNSGQHYFFGVDESGVISLHVMMLGSYERKFDIFISQIACEGERRAPPHCLQYYTGTHGRVKSFNYDLLGGNVTDEGYPNDIDYMMCVKKEPGFCSITYELSTSDRRVRAFGIGNPHKLTGRGNLVTGQCNEDYLVIGGYRICSASVGVQDGLSFISDVPAAGFSKTDVQTGSILNATLTSPALLTDTTPGPFLLRFISSQANNAKGFDLSFRQNPCK